MKKNIAFFIAILTIPFVACNRGPYETPYYMAVGYVIGKESCKNDDKKDYWLIEISSSSSARQQYGDTLTLNGTKYTNVIKSTGLDDKLKIVGQKVGLDFYISNNTVITSGCTVATPTIYNLKDANILQSREWR